MFSYKKFNQFTKDRHQNQSKHVSILCQNYFLEYCDLFLMKLPNFREQDWVKQLKFIDQFHKIAERLLIPLGISIMDSHLPINRLYVETCTKLGLFNMKSNKWFYCNDRVHPERPVLNTAARMMLNHAFEQKIILN